MGSTGRAPIGPSHERLGARLRRLRMSRGRRLRDLSEYSPSHLSEVENGLITPSRELIDYIVETLQGSNQEFITLFEAAVTEGRQINARRRLDRRLYAPPVGTPIERPAGPNEFWLGDVLVIGGGASGILVAHSLRDAGYSVSLLEEIGLGSAQSNHSHGYLHRGHIYAKPSPALVRALCEGADQWQSLLEEAGLKPLAARSCIGFANPYTASNAAAAWRRAGLEFEAVAAQRGVLESALTHRFLTQEATYCFTPWFVYAGKVHLRGVTTICGSARSLQRQAGQIVGVRVQVGTETFMLRAKFYVLAAGIGNLPLISTATNYRGSALNRMSFMFVLESRGLPKLSLVIPEHEAYGLFLVSRHLGKRNLWLASNYLSYAGDVCTPSALALWLRATTRMLRVFTTALQEENFRWGVYVAPKGELRTDRNRLDIHSVQTYGLSNVCVAAPTKLTLCPLLASAVLKKVREKMPAVHIQPKGADCSAIASRLPVLPERWESARLFPGDELRQFITDPGGTALFEQLSSITRSGGGQ